jgi:hypothetical protein
VTWQIAVGLVGTLETLILAFVAFMTLKISIEVTKLRAEISNQRREDILYIQEWTEQHFERKRLHGSGQHA